MKTGKLISMILSPVLLLSCSDDISTPENNNSVSIEIKVPRQDDLKTRAYGDGSSVNNLKCYVYAQGNGATGEPIIVDDIPLSTDSKAFYSIQLPDGQNYDLVFLATSGEQENTSGKIYYNRTDRTFNVNYSNFTANDESVDCFMGTIQNLSNAQTSYSITLKRPYAQLNIGTKDLDDYNSLSVAKLSAVDVSVDGVYSSMNVMNGNVIGSKTSVSFPQVTEFSSNPFPVPDAKYLSMNYLLMNTRENTTVTMKTTSSDGSNIDYSFNNIPLQRNFKTNIYGNLLTKSNDYKVEISPDFTGQENIDVNSDYDLVVKLVDNYKDWSMFGLKYYDKSGEYHSIDLLPYVDSDRIIQVNWSELGLENVDNLCFVYEPFSQYSNPMSELIKMDISPLRLKDAGFMFQNSKYVTNFDAISNWNTYNFRYTNYMFEGCSSLNSLNITQWNTWTVVDMSNMFKGCSSLNSLDLGIWDVSNVTDMSDMFAGCENLSSLLLDRSTESKTYEWNTANVKNMSGMFSNCKKLSDIYNFENVQAVTDMSSMYFGCESLTNCHLNAEPIRLTDITGMFQECTNLTDVEIHFFETFNIATTNRMFKDCKNLTNIHLVVELGNNTDMREMFAGCESLKTTNDISDMDTECVKDMYGLFSGCHNLEEVNLNNWDTSNVDDMGYLFFDCTNLKDVQISNWDTSNVAYMQNMFNKCISVEELDLSNWITTNVTDISNMFNHTSYLRKLYLDNWNLNHITSDSKMIDAFNTVGTNIGAVETLEYIRCMQEFKDWCMKNISTLHISNAQPEINTLTWDIVP